MGWQKPSAAPLLLNLKFDFVFSSYWAVEEDTDSIGDPPKLPPS